MYNNKDSKRAAVDFPLSERINSLRFLLIVFEVIIHKGISENIFSKKHNGNIPDYVKNVQRFVRNYYSHRCPYVFSIFRLLLIFQGSKIYSYNGKEMPDNFPAVFFVNFIVGIVLFLNANIAFCKTFL
jgi:hypothetical protein